MSNYPNFISPNDRLGSAALQPSLYSTSYGYNQSTFGKGDDYTSLLYKSMAQKAKFGTDLNLMGEQLQIKDKLLKVVNYESVYEQLEEKFKESGVAKLLFKKKKA